MTSHHLDYAIGQFAAASRLIASEPTVYEGLYAAFRGPLQSIEPNDDLPPILRASFLRSRRRLMHGLDRPFDTATLMKALRRLDLSKAYDIAYQLDCLAKQLTAKG
jgi:hypothetical protein